MWNASKVCHIFSSKKIKSSLVCINRLRQSSEVSGMAWQVCVTLQQSSAWKNWCCICFSQTILFVLYLSPINRINLGCGFPLLPQPQPQACVPPQPLNFPGFASSTCRQYDEMLTNIDAARRFFFWGEAVFETGRWLGGIQMTWCASTCRWDLSCGMSKGSVKFQHHFWFTSCTFLSFWSHGSLTGRTSWYGFSAVSSHKKPPPFSLLSWGYPAKQRAPTIRSWASEVGGRKPVEQKLPHMILARGDNTPGSTHIAGWEIPTIWVDVSPIKGGDIPASYVSLPGGDELFLIWQSFFQGLTAHLADALFFCWCQCCLCSGEKYFWYLYVVCIHVVCG